ncbi:unnamed protein product [Ascophyllum nodosum]
MAQRPRSFGPPHDGPPHGLLNVPIHWPGYGLPGHVSPLGVDPTARSTPWNSAASNVDPVGGDGSEEDIIVAGMLREAMTVDALDAAGKDGEEEDGIEKTAEEIDAPAAFETETAAARDPEESVLYQKASVCLANQFKVHLSPTQLWRVLSLFQIQGRKLVAFGLAPRHALDKNADPSSAGEEPDVDESKDEHDGAKRGKSHMALSVVANPVHHLLGLNGVDMPEDEVQPLLEALRVRPRRLVKLGVLPREILAEMPDGQGGPRGGHHGRHKHPHRGHTGPGAWERGRGGHGSHPIQPQHPLMHHTHRTHGFGILPHGPPGAQGGYPLQPHLRAGPHLPPPSVAGMHAPFPPPLHTQNASHGAAGWYGSTGVMRAPHVPSPYPYMWHAPHAYGGGYGGPTGMMGSGYGYGYGGWSGWPSHHGGANVGYGAIGDSKRGFGKGIKDNMAMAKFVAHPTGSDMTTVSSGQSFKKSWLVYNDSTTTWPETCCLIPVSQGCQDLSSPPEAPVVGDVSPGEEATVSVDLVAPSQPGMYEGYWRVCDDSQRRFGQRLLAKVTVVGAGEDVNAAVEKLSLDDGHKDN